jgi:hypothetical protein
MLDEIQRGSILFRWDDIAIDKRKTILGGSNSRGRSNSSTSIFTSEAIIYTYTSGNRQRHC